MILHKTSYRPLTNRSTLVRLRYQTQGVVWKVSIDSRVTGPPALSRFLILFEVVAQ